MLFYITFGQASHMRDGWVAVEAPGEKEARKYASNLPLWAGCYSADDPEWKDYPNSKRKYFPKGQIGEVVVL